MTEQPPLDPFNQQGQLPDQGQPFGGPGGQPTPAYYGGYQPPGWRPIRRRRRHPFRGALTALSMFIGIGIVAGAVAASRSVTERPQVNVTPFSAPSKSVTAQIGSAIVLAGNSAGEKVAVTAVKVFTHARPSADFGTVPTGDRLYAVQFRLDNTGTASYLDAPSNGAMVVDSAGQSHQASLLNTVADCSSFPAADHIATGDSGLGCIVFDVPVNARITMVKFTLDSGFGPQAGQWQVRS
jgi:hypothetical protein